MALIENTLFGEKNKIKIAIKRIQEFEPEEGYFLAFSGGKDSQTIYELAKMSGVKFQPFFNLTTVDPPELIYFIRKYYNDVKFNRPSISMWSLIIKKMFPPTRRIRYCCEYLKEGRISGIYNKFLITGIRWEESTRRKSRKIIERCLVKRNTTYINPIIDWTSEDIWEFIKLRKLKYCSLYDEGFKRIGCIMCPLQRTEGMLREAKRYPKYYKKYLRTFERMIKEREKNKREQMFGKWNTPEDVMSWWIYGKEHKGNPDQTVIFE